MSVTYKDIDLLSKKSGVEGTEKLPVSDTEYITPGQIIEDVTQKIDTLYTPPGFRRLAWLGSDSSAFIDTGVAGKAGLTVKARLYYGTHVNYGAFYGNYNTDSANGYRGILGSAAGDIIFATGSSFTGTAISGYVAPGIWFDLEARGDGDIYLDGVLRQSLTLASTIVTDNICLFNRSLTNQASPIRDIQQRTAYFSIEDNGAVILYLVPMVRLSDGEKGMYDMVSDTFIINSGAGVFSSGDVIPDPAETAAAIHNTFLLASTGEGLVDRTPTVVSSLQFNAKNTAFEASGITTQSVYYVPVSIGDSVKVTASHSTAQVFKYGFCEAVPASGVSIIGGIRLEQTSINLDLTSPVNGYCAVFHSESYFTDQKIYSINDTPLNARIKALEGKITISDAEPTSADGEDGDIWIVI